MDVLVPSFVSSLVTSQIWVGGDKNSVFDVFFTECGGESSGTPREIKNVVFKILPRVTKIFGKIKLFVNFTRFVIFEILAGGPSSSKSP